jgi:hypothetical protein
MLIHPEIDWWNIISEIYACNKAIWNLESVIRLAKIDHDLNEIGLRTIQIREFNKQRVGVKNSINKLFGEGYPEQKKDHASE